MAEVSILTDSTSCLTNDLLREYNIGLVPTGLIVDGKVYLDQVEITSDQFWKLFDKTKSPITTAAASPGSFLAKFEELSHSSNSIICILVSKALTATHQAAYAARDLVKAKNPDLNIEIVDSKTSTGALGYIALEAARAALQGKNLAGVMQVVQNMIPRVKYVAMLETMKYLIRQGRAPKTADPAALENVKPFIGMVSGTGLLEDLGRVSGKEKAMAKMVDMIADYADVTQPLHVMVHYADKIEDGEQLKKMVNAKYKVSELYVSPYTPVMACHTGPVLSIAFYADIKP